MDDTNTRRGEDRQLVGGEPLVMDKVGYYGFVLHIDPYSPQPLQDLALEIAKQLALFCSGTVLYSEDRISVSIQQFRMPMSDSLTPSPIVSDNDNTSEGWSCGTEDLSEMSHQEVS